MKRTSQTRLTLLLATALIGVSFNLFAWSNLDRDADLQAPPLTQNNDKTSPLIEERQLPGLRRLQETVSRPLFRATRRAPVIEDTPKETVVAERRSYELVGVTLFGKRRLALIRALGESRLLRVSEGQRVDRWRVLRIEAHRIVLTRGQEHRELRLKDGTRARPRKALEPRRQEAEPAKSTAAASVTSPATVAADDQ